MGPTPFRSAAEKSAETPHHAAVQIDAASLTAALVIHPGGQDKSIRNMAYPYQPDNSGNTRLVISVMIVLITQTEVVFQAQVQ